MNNEALDAALDLLAPREVFVGEWGDVLARAGRRTQGARSGRSQFITRRRVLIVAVALAALLIPLVALGASSDWNWWFLRFSSGTGLPISTTSTGNTTLPASPAGPAPAPLSGGPTIVASGSWEGKSWVLVAYLSQTDGVCYAVSPSETAHSNGMGAAMNCDRIEGVPHTPDSKPYTAHSITYLIAGSSPLLPGYIAGMVVGTAESVDVYLSTGEVLHTQTFAGPAPLGTIRFYAAQLPASARATPGDTSSVFDKLVGLNKHRKVVACFGAC